MKHLRTILAVILVFVLALGEPMRAFAASDTLYISEVMVGMGESAEEAKNALANAGFAVLDTNLNEGAGSALKKEKYVSLIHI